MNKNIRLMVFLVFICLVTGGIVLSDGYNSGQIIRVGFIGPLTGDASTYGISIKQGIDLALVDAVKSGLVKENQIEIIYEDGKCDSKEAVLAAQKLINIDHVRIIFGGQCSGETLAIAPIVEKAGVLLISSFSTSPDVTKAGDNVSRIPPSDANSGKIIAETIVVDGYNNIGIISEKTAATQTIIPIFESKIKELNKNIVYKESFTTDTSDLNTLATKIKDVNPEALYVNVQTGASGSRVIKQVRDIGYQGKIYTFFITGDDFVKSGSWVNEVIIIDLRSAKDAKTLSDFTLAFVSLFGVEPAYPFGSTLGYDAGIIIFEAISKVGNNSEKIKDYLYNMKSRPSLTGDLSFDQNGDPIGNDVYYLRKIVDNKLINL